MSQDQEMEQTEVGKAILALGDTPERRAIVEAHEVDQLYLRQFIREVRDEDQQSFLGFLEEHLTRLMNHQDGQFNRVYKEQEVIKGQLTDVQIQVNDYIQALVFRYEARVTDLRQEVSVQLDDLNQRADTNESDIATIKADIQRIKEHLGL